MVVYVTSVAVLENCAHQNGTLIALLLYKERGCDEIYSVMHHKEGLAYVLLHQECKQGHLQFVCCCTSLEHNCEIPLYKLL